MTKAKGRPVRLSMMRKAPKTKKNENRGIFKNLTEIWGNMHHWLRENGRPMPMLKPTHSKRQKETNTATSVVSHNL